MMSIATPSDVISAVGRVVGNAARPISLHEPLFTGNENTYVKSCIDEGWVSSVGAFVNRFERDLAAYQEVVKLAPQAAHVTITLP